MNATESPQRRLPAGTVTLLFADVEGLTRLLHLLGERFAPARTRMRALVREAARAQSGAEVDWAGDGVFLAFPRARDAVAAAAQIQRSLADEPWPDDEAHRLRIGMHTGEPDLGEKGYVGMDVVIAARVCASAHGEQIVVTQATRDVSGDEPLAGGSYRPLGRHRLKDVPNAVQLFQLVSSGLREDFPPLKTLTATSLPALHHRLVGRDTALARLEELLDAQGARLVTITGPGGAGKSRLALEVAGRSALERPVHLVGLAPITDPELVPSAIARAIGARESGSQRVLDAVADRLEGKGRSSSSITSSTWRSLRFTWESFSIALPTCRSWRRAGRHSASPRNACSRSSRSQSTMPRRSSSSSPRREASSFVPKHSDPREICRRLDGLPLAIELVAARLVVLPPAEIVRALEEGLALDMEGPVDLPERQRTLRAAIDWSYRRLTESQRLLHGTLAVFSDSASLDDARSLGPEPSTFLADLEALVGWSLIRSEAGDGVLRLSMLETVREHALACLAERDALGDLRRRHAERFLALALTAESELTGTNQAEWLERLEREFDNIGSTLDWLLSAGRVEDALRASAALSRFWRGHGHVTEARRWLALGLDLAHEVPPGVRADALWAAARQASAQSDWEAAREQLESALPLFRASGRSREVAFTLSELAFIAIRLDDVDRAADLCEEALAIARELDDPRAVSAALLTLAESRSLQGEHTKALEHDEEAVAIRRALGDPLLVTNAVHNLGWVALLAGDATRARAAFEESLGRARELGDTLHTAEALRLLGELDLFDADADSAEERILESLALVTEVGSELDRAACLVGLGGVEALRGRRHEANRLFTDAADLRGGAPPRRPNRQFSNASRHRLPPQVRSSGIRYESPLGSRCHSTEEGVVPTNHETELGGDIEGGVPGYGRTFDEAVSDAFENGKGILSPGWLVVAATLVRVENPIREYR